MRLGRIEQGDSLEGQGGEMLISDKVDNIELGLFFLKRFCIDHIVVFQYLKKSFRRAGEGIFIRACRGERDVDLD